MTGLKPRGSTSARLAPLSDSTQAQGVRNQKMRINILSLFMDILEERIMLV